jgi:hypothetical protein
MQREEIEIEIRPDGKVEYRIVGVKGSACDQISAVLEELGKVEASERTAEYYDQEPDVHVTLGDA